MSKQEQQPNSKDLLVKRIARLENAIYSLDIQFKPEIVPTANQTNVLTSSQEHNLSQTSLSAEQAVTDSSRLNPTEIRNTINNIFNES